MLGESTQDWEVKTQGTYGEFHTLAGKVSYLMTKAKLKADTTPEGILTKYLAPVREVLDIKDLDFNQLLQRDLDDYRVATDLVDYLLKPNFVGPAFYTPILAAVLPFDGPEPVDHYPQVKEPSIFTDVDKTVWQQTEYGEAFRVLKIWDANSQRLHKIPLGRLDFNTKYVKPVVIDGQHRAMALLAIRRTIDHNWKEGGSAYRYFYEQRINDLLKDQPKDFLENIEFPVCICWFPHPTSDNSSWPNPHKAARKLFVDVNKNARSPSKSRLILLSDSELTSIFVREFLNHLRTEDALFPLHAIEYDYPHEQGEGVPRKTALASILMLNGAIEWALQGPDKYIKDVNKTIQQGRVNEKEKKQRLHRELELEQCLAPEINDQGINGPIKFVRKDLTNEHFPKTEIPTLIQQFWQGWGTVILHIFSDFFPFKCHIEALKELELGWNATEDHGALARNAMFQGLGIYWTLKEDYRQWSENNQNGELQGIPKQDKQDQTETVKAWYAIQDKEKSFQEKRTKKLFYSQQNLENKEKAAANIYKRLLTQAFLSGAVLTLASLKYQLKYDSQTFKERAIVWIKSWNLALQASPERIHIFDANQSLAEAQNLDKRPFLDFIKLNPAAAVYFRYLLLEFMQVSGSEEFTPEEQKAIARLLSQARKLYLDALVTEEEKSLKKRTNQSNEADKDKVKADAKDKLKRFCQQWFKISQYEFDKWYEDAKSLIQNDSQNLNDRTDFDDDN